MTRGDHQYSLNFTSTILSPPWLSGSASHWLLFPFYFLIGAKCSPGCVDTDSTRTCTKLFLSRLNLVIFNKSVKITVVIKASSIILIRQGRCQNPVVVLLCVLLLCPVTFLIPILYPSLLRTECSHIKCLKCVMSRCVQMREPILTSILTQLSSQQPHANGLWLSPPWLVHNFASLFNADDAHSLNGHFRPVMTSCWEHHTVWSKGIIGDIVRRGVNQSWGVIIN